MGAGLNAWGSSWGSAWGSSWGSDAPVEAILDGGVLRRRRRARPALPKLHPEEIARQQREDQRYLEELARAKPRAPAPANVQIVRPPAPLPAAEAILSDALARAASAELLALTAGEAAAAKSEQDRRKALLLLVIA